MFEQGGVEIQETRSKSRKHYLDYDFLLISYHTIALVLETEFLNKSNLGHEKSKVTREVNSKQFSTRKWSSKKQQLQ